MEINQLTGPTGDHWELCNHTEASLVLRTHAKSIWGVSPPHRAQGGVHVERAPTPGGPDATHL